MLDADTDTINKSSGSHLPERDFKRLREFIRDECGINIGPAKKVMLETRLMKRLRKLGMDSFQEYCDFLFSPKGLENELVHMIDVITTNKTDFFREPEHFRFLAERAVPGLITGSGAGLHRKLMVWSAGCSSGEEPYTLAMVLNEFASQHSGLKFEFTVLATDISVRVLEAAQRAVYEHERVEPIPFELRRKYLLRSRDSSLVKIAPHVREAVQFRRLNFMDHDFGFKQLMDIIFCRNVFIYFDRPTQEKLLRRFCGCLRPGGYIFMGHSETLNGLDVPLESVGNMVYRKS